MLLVLLHLLLLAFNCLLFATTPAFRGHRSTFIIIIILYIFVLFIIAFNLCLGVKNFSLSFVLFYKRQTDRQKQTIRPLDDRDPHERGGKGCCATRLNSSLFFLLSRYKTLRKKEIRNEMKAFVDVENRCIRFGHPKLSCEKSLPFLNWKTLLKRVHIMFEQQHML